MYPATLSLVPAPKNHVGMARSQDSQQSESPQKNRREKMRTSTSIPTKPWTTSWGTVYWVGRSSGRQDTRDDNAANSAAHAEHSSAQAVKRNETRQRGSGRCREEATEQNPHDTPTSAEYIKNCLGDLKRRNVGDGMSDRSRVR